MKHIPDKKTLVTVFFHVLLVAVPVLLFSGSLGFKRDSPNTKNVIYIETVQISVNNGPWQKITLPYHIEDLPAQTPVRLKATIQPANEDCVYIKSSYASADVYLDDKLAFTFGKMDNYPKFMMDPAIEIHIIETNGTGADMEVRVEYLSSKTSPTFSLEPIMVGTSKELILERSTKFGFSLVLSLAQIIGGAMLLIISLFVLFIDRKGIMFFWLGLFSLTTGSWVLGSNNAAITLIPDTTWLYLLKFVGLTTFIVPLLEFFKIAIDFTDPKPVWIMELFFDTCASAALILQMLGIFPLNRSVRLFRFTLTPALFALTGLVILEFVRYKNPYARRFIFPSATLSCCVALQLIHDSFVAVNTNLHLFQIGVNIFLLVMGITASIYVKDSIDLKNKQKELLFEKKNARYANRGATSEQLTSG